MICVFNTKSAESESGWYLDINARTFVAGYIFALKVLQKDRYLGLGTYEHRNYAAIFVMSLRVC